MWISENYHDFKNMGMFLTDTNAMDRAIFAALKPGGTYFITDYVAPAGSGTRDTQSLHRIDPEVIKREVTAAGFMLEAQSDALINPSDDLAARSRQGASQVMLRFRKPRKTPFDPRGPASRSVAVLDRNTVSREKPDTVNRRAPLVPHRREWKCGERHWAPRHPSQWRRGTRICTGNGSCSVR